MRILVAFILVSTCAIGAFAETVKFTSQKYGFSIELPKGWTISQPGIEKAGGYENNYPVRATHSGVVISVSVEDAYGARMTEDQRKTTTRGDLDAYWNNEKNVDEVATGMIEGMQKALPTMAILDRKVIDFDGTKALDLRYSAIYSSSGQQIELVLLLRMLTKNGLQYGITSSCAKNSYETYAPVLLQAMESFDAPYTLDASQRAGARAPKTDIWRDWVLPILSKGAAQFIVGGTIAAIAVLIGIFRARAAAKKRQGGSHDPS